VVRSVYDQSLGFGLYACNADARKTPNGDQRDTRGFATQFWPKGIDVTDNNSRMCIARGPPSGDTVVQVLHRILKLVSCPTSSDKSVYVVGACGGRDLEVCSPALHSVVELRQ
jgi:hypothetical protein